MLKWTWGNPLLSGYSNKPQKGYVEIEPDAGLPFRRLTFSDIQDLVTATFSLTRYEYQRFYSWYKYDLRQGTLPFKMFDCRYGIDRTARLIGDVPQFQANNKRQNLSVTIAFEPSSKMIDACLMVGNNSPLIVNNNDALLVSYELRI